MSVRVCDEYCLLFFFFFSSFFLSTTVIRSSWSVTREIPLCSHLLSQEKKITAFATTKTKCRCGKTLCTHSVPLKKAFNKGTESFVMLPVIKCVLHMTVYEGPPISLWYLKCILLLSLSIIISSIFRMEFFFFLMFSCNLFSVWSDQPTILCVFTYLQARHLNKIVYCMINQFI